MDGIKEAQYKSLRKNFHKMIDNVLGADYYNCEHDVYSSEKECCEAITRKANRTLIQHLKDSIIEAINKSLK